MKVCLQELSVRYCGGKEGAPLAEALGRRPSVRGAASRQAEIGVSIEQTRPG